MYGSPGVVCDVAGNVLYENLNNFNEFWYDAEGPTCASQVIGGGAAYPITPKSRPLSSWNCAE